MSPAGAAEDGPSGRPPQVRPEPRGQPGVTDDRQPAPGTLPPGDGRRRSVGSVGHPAGSRAVAHRLGALCPLPGLTRPGRRVLLRDKAPCAPPHGLALGWRTWSDLMSRGRGRTVLARENRSPPGFRVDVTRGHGGRVSGLQRARRALGGALCALVSSSAGPRTDVAPVTLSQASHVGQVAFHAQTQPPPSPLAPRSCVSNRHGERPPP